MNTTPDHYIQASADRLAESRVLHDGSRYAGAIYLAGVGVEALLHAFRTRIDPQFENRHDLKLLLKASGLLEIVTDKNRLAITAALGEVWSRWKNPYRYASNDRLLADLKTRKIDRSVRGDPLKFASKTVLDAAFLIYEKGKLKWN